MNNGILHLVVLAVVCGAVMSIIPEGGIKNISNILTTLILVSSIISFVGKQDFREYVQQAANVDNIEREFELSVSDDTTALKYTYLEEQCIEYILEEAKANSITIYEIDLEICDDKQYELCPYSVSLIGEWDAKNKQNMANDISANLGIPAERQYWHYG